MLLSCMKNMGVITTTNVSLAFISFLILHETTSGKGMMEKKKRQDSFFFPFEWFYLEIQTGNHAKCTVKRSTSSLSFPLLFCSPPSFFAVVCHHHHCRSRRCHHSVSSSFSWEDLSLQDDDEEGKMSCCLCSHFKQRQIIKCIKEPWEALRSRSSRQCKHDGLLYLLLCYITCLLRCILILNILCNCYCTAFKVTREVSLLWYSLSFSQRRRQLLWRRTVSSYLCIPVFPISRERSKDREW